MQSKRANIEQTKYTRACVRSVLWLNVKHVVRCQTSVLTQVTNLSSMMHVRRAVSNRNRNTFITKGLLFTRIVVSSWSSCLKEYVMYISNRIQPPTPIPTSTDEFNNKLKISELILLQKLNHYRVFHFKTRTIHHPAHFSQHRNLTEESTATRFVNQRYCGTYQ